MATLAFTNNGTQGPTNHKGGTAILVAQGSLGGGTLSFQFQTAEMEKNSEWSTVSDATSGTLVPLSIGTVDRPVTFPLPSCKIRATLAGATAPNCRLYVDVAT